MIYLSGHVSEKLPQHIGVMLTPNMGNRLPDGRIWGADNGCFSAPHLFSRDVYVDWLQRHSPAANLCLFATMPDVVGDAAATLENIGDWPVTIRSMGYPVALVAQDGLESMAVPWDDLDVLFIGGTTDWKLSGNATTLVRAAKERGKWAHHGRVNSLRRLRHVQWQGCDSADGTFCAFGPDINIPKMTRWISAIQAQPRLFYD